ncbi:MAG: isoleucine--tRNA ligase [Clostridiales Family XIII bacterium]|nr:isoleucine--tRNA ligase [Clostridiales Family XIII bacterium]
MLMFKNLSDQPIAEVQTRQAGEWEDSRLLERCVTSRAGGANFNFYEGPPTANGRPGIHHVLSRTLKDSVCRYKTMRGFAVRRKAGWDTHGLPVEIEVEKELKLRSKKDIEAYGIREFNRKCRESVFKYEGVWRDMSRRMGFLIDMDHPYITLENDYIESCWWILKEFFKAGLIYEGRKVLPYCPRCGTGLASHEVALGYKEVKANTVTAMFRRRDEDAYFLAWTTTPWTLASNVSLTVGPDVDYIKARLNGDRKEHGGKTVYLAKALADRTLGAGAYSVIAEMKGRDLEFAEYDQLMPFIEVKKKSFYVTCADYVTVEDGTGVVHTAPAFGEDDYNTGRRYGLPVVNPVDEEGKYTETPWAGRFVMEDGLDVEIIKWLASEGKLFSREKVLHNYPHCWRCGSPLIYYSRQSWYIEMTKLKDELVAYNGAVRWFPDFVGEKRFGNWLENVNDWAVSRTRYWGTPIPIWRCADCGEFICAGSRKELAEKSIENVSEEIELHRPDVDEIHIRCEKCGGVMSRTPEVMDCWFDSGAMPFAQRHYPFENTERFDEDMFPADFICEGIDQTRGWFYSLIAISAFIRKSAPYRNVLVNDLILDKNGKKMSKSKGNTADPFALFDAYGADATRWYLLYASPAWTPTKFDEDALREIAGKFFGTLRNVYHFFVLYSNQDGVDPRGFSVSHAARPELDRWILSKYNRLIGEVAAEMERYDHMKSVRLIQHFVLEDLSNWYIRRARRRFWAEGLTEDKKSVYATAYEILTGVARLAAPFAPFIADEIYQNLTGEESVHLAMYPSADADRVDDAAEKRMDLVRGLVTLGRNAREKEGVKVRQPLAKIIVDGKHEAVVGDMTALLSEELNVKEVVFEKNLDEYMDFRMKPDFRVAGPALGGKIKAFAKALAGESVLDLRDKFERDGRAVILLDGEPTLIEKDYVDILISAKRGFSAAMEDGLFVIMDTALTPELAAEGLARELVSKVQQIRKQRNFDMMDRIHIRYGGGGEVEAAVRKHREYIMRETLALSLEASDGGLAVYDLNGHDTGIAVERAR